VCVLRERQPSFRNSADEIFKITPGIYEIGPPYQYRWSRGSSVSIVSYYGLDDRGSIPDRGRGSGTHPASCPMGTGGKARPGRDADHSPPSSAEVENE
jgi:hypothetical protein